ncbi:MAG TPA: hypothetical protein VFC46_04845 [Humisphaera sp.]|nr:hypothetical protein [Humisphaera sp.]
MTELLFIVEEREDGFCNARAVGADIAAQAVTRKGVESSVREAIRERFHAGGEMPEVIHLHFVHDKTIPLAETPEWIPQEIEERLRGSVLKDDDPFGPADQSDPAHPTSQTTESTFDWRMLRGTLLHYDNPTDPVGVEDWEALK